MDEVESDDEDGFEDDIDGRFEDGDHEEGLSIERAG